jgi:hypothetical protein
MYILLFKNFHRSIFKKGLCNLLPCQADHMVILKYLTWIDNNSGLYYKDILTIVSEPCTIKLYDNCKCLTLSLC